jgi:hypothetical protein
MLGTVILSLLFGGTASAWNGKGHEVVAYIAYQHLDPATKTKVDALLQKNPCFTEWSSQVSSLPANQRSAAIFMLAATWPDMIKAANYDCQTGQQFVSDGSRNGDVAPSGPEASQNIGYSDTRRHKYWHFIDTPFSTDGTQTKLPTEPNALSEILKLSAALASSEPDELKSYDLVWIEHLVGDVHQPLHDTSRFTQKHQDGDAGGNLVPICNAAGCKQELHAYWDGILGTENVNAALTMGKQLNLKTPPTGTNELAASVWVNEGFELAKSRVYQPPISSDEPNSPVGVPDKQYQAVAKNVAQSQVLLAGYRLAGLLNGSLNGR